jgi:peptidoglycan lytic transglycosylase
MVVRLGAALCVVVIMFAFSTSSSSVIKPASIKLGNVIRGAAVDQSSAQSSVQSWPVDSAVMAHKQNKEDAAVSSVTFLGTASTYNPFRPGYRSGGPETASGEQYDPAAWTAAIQIDLREMFGGVRFGKDYQPSYALVAKNGKQAIVKINDVGPLEPGRVIDFNEQTMRYFDPSLELGLIALVEVTPLRGMDWLPGPVADD